MDSRSGNCAIPAVRSIPRLCVFYDCISQKVSKRTSASSRGFLAQEIASSAALMPDLSLCLVPESNQAVKHSLTLCTLFTDSKLFLTERA